MSICPATAPYADSLTHLCGNTCSNKQYRYLTTGATSGGSCRFYCPSGYFANPKTMTCETSCPSGLFADTTNNTCTEYCLNDNYMDSANNKCVTQCPGADNLFGNPYTN